MKRVFLFAAGYSLIFVSPLSAKPKHGVPPGQVRKAEVHAAKAWGKSPSRKWKTPPVDVCRTWEHERVYSWNEGRYRWSGSTWIIVID